MRIIGLLGGVASGKSVVAQELAQLGACILDADQAGHQVLQMPHVQEAIRTRWGQEVFGPDGQVDRARLAQRVFADSAQAVQDRRYLEEITHPEIGQLLRCQAQTLAETGCPAAVLDAPLLLEVGWDRWCDKLVFVDAPLEVRQTRALARGWTLEQFAAREAAQWPVEQKRLRADIIIDNSGSLEKTHMQVLRFWQSLIPGPAYP
ncbi:MAG TPA: dephospho-CoA kinase [Thermoguttaceae bacterium]|nr:dephospho-CoA kinase [Thermoguttaceae bacterium]HPP53791.1 dephospho-CoA kinase [Thermoguttaceae bacterium]